MVDKEYFLTLSSYFRFIQPDPGVQWFELKNVYCWEVQNGIFFVVYKDELEQLSPEEFDVEVEFWKDISIQRGQRLGLIAAVNPKMLSAKDEKIKVSVHVPMFMRASAVIVDSFLLKIAIQFKLKLRKARAYTVRPFTNAIKAEKWMIDLMDTPDTEKEKVINDFM